MFRNAKIAVDADIQWHRYAMHSNYANAVPNYIQICWKLFVTNICLFVLFQLIHLPIKYASGFHSICNFFFFSISIFKSVFNWIWFCGYSTGNHANAFHYQIYHSTLLNYAVVLKLRKKNGFEKQYSNCGHVSNSRLINICCTEPEVGRQKNRFHLFGTLCVWYINVKDRFDWH